VVRITLVATAPAPLNAATQEPDGPLAIDAAAAIAWMDVRRRHPQDPAGESDQVVAAVARGHLPGRSPRVEDRHGDRAGQWFAAGGEGATERRLDRRIAGRIGGVPSTVPASSSWAAVTVVKVEQPASLRLWPTASPRRQSSSRGHWRS
jgi:hypothetical protein